MNYKSYANKHAQSSTHLHSQKLISYLWGYKQNMKARRNKHYKIEDIITHIQTSMTIKLLEI